MLSRRFPRGAVKYFFLGKDALQENFAVLFDHLGDADTLDNISTNANQVPWHFIQPI